MGSITKICTHCEREVNISDFGNDKNWCIDCKRKSRRESAKRNKATKKAYEATHKEQRSEIQKRWKKNNPEKYKASRNYSVIKQWIAENKDKVRGYARKWKEKNRDKIRGYAQKWKDGNGEKINKYQREWKAKNLDKVSAYRHANRAKRRSAEGKYTAEEWRELCERYDNRCLCCNEVKPLTADHVIPLSKGGTNYIDNIQPLCKSCNCRKSTKTIDYRCKMTS